MRGASRNSNQLMLLDWVSGTSSPASEAGPTPCDLPVSRTTPASGPAHALASRSATQDESAESPTTATSGPSGSGSSASAVLQSSLASRLRVELDGHGSMLYSLTWKDLDTPAGRQICQLQASALRTGDSGCSSWPTPTVADGTAGRETFHHGESNPTLLGAARCAAWPTPDKMSGDRSLPADPTAKTRPSGAKVHFTINHAAATAAWPTPAARDWKSSASNKHGDNARPLNEVARLSAAWPTPRACDGAKGSTSEKPERSEGPDLPTVAGRTATGSAAPTESRGQLNPEHTRWLMGYPDAWASCGATAMRSSRKSRRRSSRRR